MKPYDAQKIRNVAIIGHGGSGKTTLAEALLHQAGAVNRQGRVEEGNTVSDFDPDEQRRKVSISTALLPLEWGDSKVNLLDTPGYADFAGEVKEALRVADSAIVVICGVNGVEVGTDLVTQYADERALPRIYFVSRLDREHADFAQAVRQIEERQPKAVVLQLPIGQEHDFSGIVDLLSQKAYAYDHGKPVACAIPAGLRDEVQTRREKLLDAVAEVDDKLLEKYLEGEELSEKELRDALCAGTCSGTVVPILCGAGLPAIGIDALLDAIVGCLPTAADIFPKPSPSAPLAALIFKTLADPFVGKISYFRVYSGVMKADSHVWNATRGHDERVGPVMYVRGKSQEPAGEIRAGDIGALNKLGETSTGDTLTTKEHPVALPAITFPSPTYEVAVEPKTKADTDKLGSALARLMEEDPTIRMHRDPETGETIVSGMGDQHLEVSIDRLKRKFGLELLLHTPRVAYRETITRRAQARERFKRQTGGHGQFGDCQLVIEPLTRGEGFVFENQIFGGSVPRQYIPAVEKGVQETMAEGVIAGKPMVDVKVIINDGSYHTVDSSEMAFKIASSMTFKKACETAHPVILEPIVSADIVVPEASMGDVMGDITAKRGRIGSMESLPGGFQRILAQVPQAEMLRYAIDLRSLTQGRGRFTVAFSHYEEAPAHVTQQIIDEHAKEFQAAHA